MGDETAHELVFLAIGVYFSVAQSGSDMESWNDSIEESVIEVIKQENNEQMNVIIGATSTPQSIRKIKKHQRMPDIFKEPLRKKIFKLDMDEGEAPNRLFSDTQE